MTGFHMVYLLMISASIACIYLYDIRRVGAHEKVCFVALFIMYVVVAGLRYRIGTDSIMYERVFGQESPVWSIRWDEMSQRRFDIGYIVFSSVIRSFTSDFMWLQLVHAIIVNSVVFMYARRNTAYPYTVIGIYLVVCYIFFMSEQMRQSMAVAVFLLAWPSYLRGDSKRYLLMVAVATLFHISALVLALLPLATAKPVEKFFRPTYAALAACVVLMACGWIWATYYERITSCLPDSMSARLLTYADDEGGLIHRLNWKGSSVYLCRTALWAFAALVVSRMSAGRNEDKSGSALVAMTMCYIYASVVGSQMPMMARLSDYFVIFAITVAARAIYSGEMEWRRYTVSGRACAMLILVLTAAHATVYFVATGPDRGMRAYATYYPYAWRMRPVRNPERERLMEYYVGAECADESSCITQEQNTETI